MRDVFDYVQRVFFAALLCPVAIAFWATFAYAGFSLDGLFGLMAEVARQYAAMDEEGRMYFALEIYAVWAVLTFGVLFVTYVLKPPRFDYALRREGGHWSTEVTERR